MKKFEHEIKLVLRVDDIEQPKTKKNKNNLTIVLYVLLTVY